MSPTLVHFLNALRIKYLEYSASNFHFISSNDLDTMYRNFVFKITPLFIRTTHNIKRVTVYICLQSATQFFGW
jgi:hypothetical protein